MVEMTEPSPEGRLSDKAIQYIESNMSNECVCSHFREDHNERKWACKYPVTVCQCDEFKPINGSRLWKEASERDESGQW
jgi:predicted N-acyltransferase